MSRPENFDRVGDLLAGACEATPASASTIPTEASPTRMTTSGTADLSRAIASIWPEVAGSDVAANATPVRLKAGKLTVSTSSSVWAHTLQYMSLELMTRLNDRLGQEAIDQIVFRHAGWEERGSRRERPDARQIEPAREGVLSAEQTEALASIDDLDLPPGLREAISRAMHASFSRNKRDPVR